jgi:hypothetical protein
MYFSQEDHMKPNVGGMDLSMRMVIGIALLLTGLIAPISTVWQIVALMVATIALITAVLRFCPISYLLGINTCELKDKK